MALDLVRFAPHLRGTTSAGLGNDVVAGLAVAALAVPQGMAYALVAGVPAEMGLLAAALPAVAAALFGSSPYLVTGPTNPIALIVGASIVAPAVAAGGGVPIATVLEASLVAGVFLLGFGLLDLGRASRFVSDSVIAGFASGAGLLIALGQLPAALGVAPPAIEVAPLAPRSWALIRGAAEAVLGADPRAASLALGVPAVILLLRRVDRRLPGPLLALAGATGISLLAGWGEGSEGLALVGAVPRDLLTLGVPTLVDPVGVAAPALAIALLATVQSIAAARSLPMPRGQRFDPDRELFGQGVANLMAAVAGAIPVCGSLTRSALARAAGARSRLGPAASGLVVALVVPLLATFVSLIPLSALAGLVVFSGIDLINPVALRRASLTRGDAVVLVGTFAATLWIDLVQAVYVGLLLALGLLVRRAGRLRISEIVLAGPGRLREIPVDAQTGTAPAVLLNLEGDLSFAVAPDLRDRLLEIAARGSRVVVLRMKRTPSLDATVLEVLRRVVRELASRQVRVLLCGLTDDRVALLRRTELGRELGEEGLIPVGLRLAEGLEQAVRRAREIVAAPRDEEIFRTEERQEWGYEI